jgi:hypothetical protein
VKSCGKCPPPEKLKAIGCKCTECTEGDLCNKPSNLYLFGILKIFAFQFFYFRLFEHNDFRLNQNQPSTIQLINNIISKINNLVDVFSLKILEIL